MNWSDIYEYAKELLYHLLNEDSQAGNPLLPKDEKAMRVVKHLKDTTYLNEALNQRQQFDYRKAFRKYEIRTVGKKIVFGICTGIAASVLIASLLFLYQLGNKQVMQDTSMVVTNSLLNQTIKAKAFLETSDGHQIKLNDSFYRQQENTGVTFISDSTGLRYIAEPKKEKIKGAKDSVRTNTLTVPRGGMYQVVLADQTKVWMNSDSKLIYPIAFEGEQREVVLSGEAYFEVAKDAARPFIVKTDLGEITVYGTQFNVKCYPEEKSIITTLVEGKVGFSNSVISEQKLTPNMQLIFLEEEGVFQMREVDVQYFVGWKDNDLYMKNEPLENIMRILSRWYDLNFVFQDECLRTVPFSGRLDRYDSVETFLHLFEYSSNLCFELQGNTVYIKAK